MFVVTLFIILQTGNNPNIFQLVNECFTDSNDYIAFDSIYMAFRKGETIETKN